MRKEQVSTQMLNGMGIACFMIVSKLFYRADFLLGHGLTYTARIAAQCDASSPFTVDILVP